LLPATGDARAFMVVRAINKSRTPESVASIGIEFAGGFKATTSEGAQCPFGRRGFAEAAVPVLTMAELMDQYGALVKLTAEPMVHGVTYEASPPGAFASAIAGDRTLQRKASAEST
jgi:hypothetical protein